MISEQEALSTLKQTSWFVYATDFEQQALWEKWAKVVNPDDKHRIRWEQHPHGVELSPGNGSTSIAVRWVHLGEDRTLVAFVDPTSRVVDWQLVENYLRQFAPVERIVSPENFNLVVKNQKRIGPSASPRPSADSLDDVENVGKKMTDLLTALGIPPEFVREIPSRTGTRVAIIGEIGERIAENLSRSAPVRDLSLSPVRGKTFAFDGTLPRKSRDEAKEAVLRAGGLIVDKLFTTGLNGIRCNADYLVVGEKAGQRTAMAKELGVPALLSEDDLDRMLALAGGA